MGRGRRGLHSRAGRDHRECFRTSRAHHGRLERLDRRDQAGERKGPEQAAQEDPTDCDQWLAQCRTNAGCSDPTVGSNQEALAEVHRKVLEGPEAGRVSHRSSSQTDLGAGNRHAGADSHLVGVGSHGLVLGIHDCRAHFHVRESCVLYLC
jgi:hypothetical protein